MSDLLDRDDLAIDRILTMGDDTMPDTNLFVDIETVPLAAALALPYPKDQRQAPANYKNPEAIANWHLRDEADWRESRIKKCSLSPMFGRIVCLGTQYGAPIAAAESAEPALLREFWERAAQAERIVTFNGTSFDLRFLIVRSMIHQINPTVPSAHIRGWRQRGRTDVHYDVRAVLTNWNDHEEGTLTDWASTLGAPVSTEFDGSDIYDAYVREDFHAIQQHCEDDIRALIAVYHRTAPYFASLEPRAA